MRIENKKSVSHIGQGLVEYSLIILLVAVIVIAAVMSLGPWIGNIFSNVNSSLTGEISTPDSQAASGKFAILADMQQRILDYYAQHGSWPRSWGDYAYTDIGLDPADWAGAVDDIFWNPHGESIGLANKAGDDIQIYVNDLSGNTLHLYDNWNIWCMSSSSTCYYHTIAPGNEVDISTLVVYKD